MFNYNKKLSLYAIQVKEKSLSPTVTFVVTVYAQGHRK